MGQLERQKHVGVVLGPLHKGLQVGCGHIQHLDKSIDLGDTSGDGCIEAIRQVGVVSLVEDELDGRVVSPLKESLDAPPE